MLRRILLSLYGVMLLIHHELMVVTVTSSVWRKYQAEKVKSKLTVTVLPLARPKETEEEEEEKKKKEQGGEGVTIA